MGTYPEPWEDPKSISTLGFHNLHYRNIAVQILQSRICGFYLLDPSGQGSGYQQQELSGSLTGGRMVVLDLGWYGLGFPNGVCNQHPPTTL